MATLCVGCALLMLRSFWRFDCLRMEWFILAHRDANGEQYCYAHVLKVFANRGHLWVKWDFSETSGSFQLDAGVIR